MKRYFFLGSFVLLSLTSVAQIEKGTWAIGGSVDGMYKTVGFRQSGGAYHTEYNYFRLNLAPQVGYFLADNFLLGLSTTTTFTKYTYKGSSPFGIDKSTYYVFSLYNRIYIKNVFTEESVGLGKSKQGNDADVLNASLGLGYAAFINRNVAIEPKISYTWSRLKYSDDSSDKTTGMLIGVGIQAYLRK